MTCSLPKIYSAIDNGFPLIKSSAYVRQIITYSLLIKCSEPIMICKKSNITLCLLMVLSALFLITVSHKKADPPKPSAQRAIVFPDTADY
jgi:hypothetical protein